MHPLMKHRKKWGPHSLKWPQPISLSVSNILGFCILYAIEKQLGDSVAFWHNVFYSSVSEATESCLPASQWQENGCWDFQLGGKNEMLQSVEARSRESWRGDKNVSIHANWCPDPPPGCHCLLSGAGIKGPFTRREDFHFFPTRRHPFSLTLYLRLLGQRRYLNKCWKRKLPIQVRSGEKEAGPVSLRWIWKCQSAHGQLVFQSRGEGHAEFRARAMTDGCKGTLVSAAAPQRPGLTACERVRPSWCRTRGSRGWT